MKKNYIKLTVVAICILASLPFAFSAFARNESKDNIAEERPKLSSQVVFDEKEDGWIYHSEIVYESGKPISYIFDGYNMKQKVDKEEYYVPVYDENGNEIDRIDTEYAFLSLSKTYRDDIKKIGEFFKEKKFTNEITLDDLNDLKIEKIDKNYLLKMFNKTIKSEMLTETGKYENVPFFETFYKKISDSDDEWKITYLLSNGYIEKVDIEYLNENNELLSEKNNLTQADKELLKEIDYVENEMVKKQTFSPTFLKNESKQVLTDSVSNKNSKFKMLENDNDFKELFETVQNNVSSYE